ncbi:unnamed protein product, partial [marine sediment metagenome]
VAIIDRYRDDSEGSLFAMTATADCPPNRYAAFSFGSITDDWELLAINWATFWPLSAPGNWISHNLMIYTPDASYQPVETFDPVGLYMPGLNLDWSFTHGSVTGVAGYNSTLPTRFGFFPFQSYIKSPTSVLLGSPDFDSASGEKVFDPPIRVYRDVSLGVIVTEVIGSSTDVSVSIRYRIRPRTTDGPRTG